jgi:hypothetical protein
MKGHTFRRARHGMLTVVAGERRREASCFADEVIVDFPSVVPALERMRTAFLLDERVSTIRAALTVTALEAKTGATVPLEVPVRCTCRACGGRGERWTDWCAACDGSGIEVMPHRVQVSVPAGVMHGDHFQFTVTPRHDAPTRIDLEILVR